MPGRGPRIPKTLPGKLSDLDDHLYLLRMHLRGLRHEPAHVKVLSAELRTLLCLASKTEGLLWRLLHELKVSDSVHLQLAGSVDTTHPIAQGLRFFVTPIARAGYGHPLITPGHYSLEAVIKDSEAVFVGGRSLTHQDLIRAVAEQMGTAHEDDGIDPSLAELRTVLLNGVASYIPLLATDADLALQVGERILDQAEANSIYRRKRRSQDLGDLTVVARLGLRQPLPNQRNIFTFQSHISEVEISCSARPTELAFALTKRGLLVRELAAPFPAQWGLNCDAVFALSYTSTYRQAWALTSHSQVPAPTACNLGWLEAPELVGPKLSPDREQFVYLQFLAVFERLLTPQECRQLREAPPPPPGMRPPQEEANLPRPFPQ